MVVAKRCIWGNHLTVKAGVGVAEWGWGSAATGQDVHQVISRCDHDLS